MPVVKKIKKPTLPNVQAIPNVKSEERGSVTVTKGLTKNMGDYNSARVDVSVTLPINPTKSEIAEAKATITIADGVVMDAMNAFMEDLEKA